MAELEQNVFHQGLCGCADGLGALIMAFTLGYTTPALLSMAEDPDLELTEEKESWIGAITPGAALIGSLVAGHLVERFGRRFTTMMTTLPSICAWIAVSYSSDPNQIIFARFLSGFCFGVQQVSVSVFVSETIHSKLRGKFSIFPGLLAMSGFLAVNVASVFLDWRTLALIGAGACLPLFILIAFLPETPYFLLKSGKKDKALQNLKWLKKSGKIAEIEFKELQKSILEHESDALTFNDMLSPPYRWPFCMALLLHIFQQTTGISAIMTFMGLIFDRAGSSIDPSTCSIIMTIINIGTMVYAVKLFEMYPRRDLLKFSSLPVIACLLILSAYMWIKESGGAYEHLSERLAFVPGAAFCFYAAGFSIGWGPIPWMFIGDGLQSKIKGKGASIVTATNWTFNFLTTKSFIWGISVLGSSGMFLVYAILTLLAVFVTGMYMPETYGLGATEIDKYYENSYTKKRN